MRYAQRWDRVCARHARWQLDADADQPLEGLDLRGLPEVVAARRRRAGVTRGAGRAGVEAERVFGLAYAVVCRWWDQALYWEREKVWPRRLHQVAGGDAGSDLDRWRIVGRLRWSSPCGGICRSRTSTCTRSWRHRAPRPCAQGRYWDMHGRLLSRQGALRLDHLRGSAGDIGLNVERFERDLRHSRVLARIAEDVESADLSQVAGTPTFFVNGRRHHGAYGIASLSAAVRAARTRAALVTR